MEKYLAMKWNRADWEAWSLVALCVCGFAWFILQNGAFKGDDLENFIIIRNGNFWELLITPIIGGHWSPFHRLSTWFVYWIAPMRFGAAVAVLILFHIGTLAYLHATLRVFGLKVADKVILCMYSSCALLIYGMIWWANAQLRVPHVLFCAAAIFHYVAWLKGNSNRHLWLAAAAYLLDMCVYQKAVLIPVYMLVFGYLSEPGRFRDKPMAVASLPGALLIVSMLFTVIFNSVSPQQAYPPGIRSILQTEWQCLSALSSGVLGLMVNNIKDLGSAYVVHQQYVTLCIVLLLLVFTLWASPGTWKLWIAMLGVLILDYLPAALSSRFLFGTAFLPYYSYRYHFEAVYLVAVFGGLFCVQISRDWRGQPGVMCRKVLPLAVVAVYLGINIASLAVAREKSLTFAKFQKCHGYMHNLQDGLDRIEEASPTFVDSGVPVYVAGMDGPRRTKNLVPLFIPGVRFTSVAEARYRVLDSGEVVMQPQP